MGAHVCHAHGCTKRIPPKLFVCPTHWKRLRPELQRAIWHEYRPGQERDKKPSDRYMAVHQRAVAELAFRPNDAAAYLLKSDMYRRRAILSGQGDPLPSERLEHACPQSGDWRRK